MFRSTGLALALVLAPAVPASACRCASTTSYAVVFGDGSELVPIDAHVAVLTHEDHAVAVSDLGYVPVQRLELYAGAQRIEVDVRDTPLEGGFHLRELVPRAPLATHTEHVVLARAEGDDPSACLLGGSGDCDARLGSFTTSEGHDTSAPRWAHVPTGGWERTPPPDGESCDTGAIALAAYRSAVEDDRDASLLHVEIARDGASAPAWVTTYAPEEIEVLGRGCDLSPLPQPTTPVTYRLRLVDALGHASAWIDVPFDAAHAPPPVLPDPPPPPPTSHCGCHAGARGSPWSLALLVLIARRRRVGRSR